MTGPERALVVCLVLLAVGAVLAIVGMLFEGNAALGVIGGVGLILMGVCGAALTVTFIVSRTGWKGCIWVPLAVLVVVPAYAVVSKIANLVVVLAYAVVSKIANLVAYPFLWASEAVNYAARRIGIPAWLLVPAGVAAGGALAIGVSWVIHTVQKEMRGGEYRDRFSNLRPPRGRRLPARAQAVSPRPRVQGTDTQSLTCSITRSIILHCRTERS